MNLPFQIEFQGRTQNHPLWIYDRPGWWFRIQRLNIVDRTCHSYRQIQNRYIISTISTRWARNCPIAFERSKANSLIQTELTHQMAIVCHTQTSATLAHGIAIRMGTRESSTRIKHQPAIRPHLRRSQSPQVAAARLAAKITERLNHMAIRCIQWIIIETCQPHRICSNRIVASFSLKACHFSIPLLRTECNRFFRQPWVRKTNRNTPTNRLECTCITHQRPIIRITITILITGIIRAMATRKTGITAGNLDFNFKIVHI